MPKSQKSSYPPHTRVFVGGLLYTVSKADIQQFFQSSGEIAEIYLAMDPERGMNRNRGFCYVQFLDPKSAAAAVRNHNNKTGPGGRKIGVKLANE